MIGAAGYGFMFGGFIGLGVGFLSCICAYNNGERDFLSAVGSALVIALIGAVIGLVLGILAQSQENERQTQQRDKDAENNRHEKAREEMELLAQNFRMHESELYLSRTDIDPFFYLISTQLAADRNYTKFTIAKSVFANLKEEIKISCTPRNR